jgi:hypothetical protein
MFAFAELDAREEFTRRTPIILRPTPTVAAKDGSYQ